MSNDVIFFTQIASIVGFIFALFGIYKLLIQQKDSVIQLLKEQLQAKNDQIIELKSTTPDSLSKSLHERIAIFESEIVRLKLDEVNHKKEIEEKENTVLKVRELLLELAGTIENEGLMCPDCNAPLSIRTHHPVFYEMNGREYETEVEFAQYECGYTLRDEIEESPCGVK